MGSIKKALNKVTGRDKAKEAEERARREAERQAEIEAAQKAQQSNEATAGEEESVAEVGAKETESDKKKKLKGGRKGLTVARSGGSGINV